MPTQIGTFLSQLVKTPRQIGAVIPSGPVLAGRMAQGLGPSSGRVVEIGPGTGVITDQILRAGVPPQNLVLLEMNTLFCDRLRVRFPKVAVHNENADRITSLGLRDVSCVISSLPLLNMTNEVQTAIVSAAFKTLCDGGDFVQFTYGFRPPIAPGIIGDLGLTWTREGRVWANVPPASVYRFRRAMP